MKRHSSNGFTLVELMVGIALTGFIVLVTSSMINIGNKGVITTGKMTGTVALKSLINSMLLSGDTCAQVLGVGTGTPNPQQSINPLSSANPLRLYTFPTPPSGGVWLADPMLGTTYNWGNLTINKLQFVPKTQVPTATNDGSRAYLGDIALQFSAPAGNSYGSPNGSENIPVLFKLNSSNVLIGCSAINADATQPFVLPSCNPTAGEIFVMGPSGQWSCQII